MVFYFSIGGYPGPFFQLEVVNGLLSCIKTTEHGAPPEITLLRLIDNKEWEEVLTFLLTRTWKGHYNEEGILDGTGWELKLEAYGQRLKTSGNNSYPVGFKKFLRLLNKVTLVAGVTVY